MPELDSTYLLVGAVVVLLLLVGFFSLRGKRQSGTDAYPYRLRNNFLSAAELSFYEVLRTAVNEKSTILTKVNLGDLFYVSQKDTNQPQAYRNKIAQKHVDFLVCNSATMKPIIGIELDDKSHQRQDRQERDILVDGIFEAAGLPIVHIPARTAYNVEEIRDRIKSRLAITRESAPSS